MSQGADGGGIGDDEDLLAEIEAWGNTFDALHDEDVATGVRGDDAMDAPTGVRGDEHMAAAAPPPEPTPVPEPIPTARAAAPATRPPPPLGDDELLAERVGGPGAGFLDDDPLAGNFDEPVVARAEIDFSDLGVAGPPTALGSLLGAPPPLQEVDEALAPPVEPPARRSSRRIERPATIDALEPEDEVFTSASRPSEPSLRASLPQGPTDDELFGDLPEHVAEPVSPVAATGGSATRIAGPDAGLLAIADRAGDHPVAKPGPAVVRRDQLRKASGEIDDPFAGPESTRVAAGGELERLAGERRARRESDRNEFGGGAEATRVADVMQLEALARDKSEPAPRTSGPISGAGRSAGPSIVRRAPSEVNEFDNEFSGQESTRIAELGQLEALAEENRAARVAEAAAAAKALFDEQAPAIELTVDDDFYDGFEIGDQSGDRPAAEPAELRTGEIRVAEASVRRTAHVVRRAAPAAAPGEDAGGGGVVVEMEAEPSDEFHAVQVAKLDLGGAAVPEAVRAEDDFSDVAAAMAKPLPEPRPTPKAVAAAAAVAEPRPTPKAGAAAVAVPPLASLSEARPLAPATPGDEDDFAGLDAAFADDAASISRVVPEVRARRPTPAAIGPTIDDALSAFIDAPAAPAGGDAPEGAIEPASMAPEPSSELGSAPAIGLDPSIEDAISDAVPAAAPESASAAVAEQAAAVAPLAAAAASAEPDVAPELPPPRFAGAEPELDLDRLALPELVDPRGEQDIAEQAARAILIYERELETVDDAEVAAALRCEAARLYERIADGDRARHHYEAALLADPRSFTALRGLRRLARSAGDLDEATRQLDAEIGIAGSLERRALALHRVDLLMAAGEQDLARVAVGELLDEASGDVRALLAQLELAFLDGRVTELSDALTRLGGPLADAELRSAVAVAAGHLQERDGGERAVAAAAFALASEADPTSTTALLGARRTAERDAAGAATFQLATLIASQPGGDGAGGPAAAALAMVAANTARAAGRGADAAAMLEHAIAWAPGDPLPAQHALLAAQADTLDAQRAAIGGGDPAGSAGGAGDEVHRSINAQLAALARVVDVAPTAATRTWALARIARLRLDRSAEGDHDAALDALARAAALDPSHDHVTAAHEAQLAARGDWAAIAELARARVGADPGAERDRVTAARALAALPPALADDGTPRLSDWPTPIDEAIALLAEGRSLSPGSATLVDVTADALAVAGRWSDRVALWADVATIDADQLDPELATLRAAAAAEEAVAALPPETPIEDALRTITAALEAWGKVVDLDPDNARAHGAAIALARRLGDRDVLADALARAQASRTGAAAATLGLERARTALVGAEPDLGRADDVLRELASSAPEDPRRIAATVTVAARAGRWGDAALVLEERASAAAEAGATLEAVTLRYRAAQILLDQGDDPSRAAQLLAQVLEDRPALTAASDALAAARRRMGDAAPVAPLAGGTRTTTAERGSGADAFARLVRDGELLAQQGDEPAAIALFNRALELRPGDPLATGPLERTARAAGDPAPLVRLALEELEHADSAGDARARADAYEIMASVDADMRGDTEAALIAWESAAAADPGRAWVQRQLERAYLQAGRIADLIALRERQIAALPPPPAPTTDVAIATAAAGAQADAVALGIDRACLADKDGRSDDELRAIWQDVFDRDRRQRIALFHLEALVRRAGSSPELAALEEAIAELHVDDPRSSAAFLTRAGETLAELGKLEGAIERFRAAETARAGSIPALQGWRSAALRGGLWLDFAEAAGREAAATTDDAARAALYHLSGVALMDRALVGERAIPVLRKALAADPRHDDAFVRLRILLEEQGEHDDLARLLEERLIHEDAAPKKIALHRALAEMYRNFLGDRESAKVNYRAILELEPNDLRAVAALSDICWEQGEWAEAAEALVARARLERDPQLLRAIYYRLGTIYADRIPQPDLAIKAFQRVLASDPDDVDALARIADLGIRAGEWKLALGACERLVKGEPDVEKRVAHLHRVGRIFLDGFGDRGKAERAFRMALDGAPHSDLALTQLVEFYQNAGDLRSVRVHLDRVAQAMRARLEHEPADGVSYRVISRVMAARQGAGVVGSIEVARCAAELAVALGVGDDTERALAAQPVPGDVRALVKPEADDLLYPRAVPGELRQLFALLGERIAKHVGVDLRPYGVTRGDRLRTREHPVATIAQGVADALGLGEIDVYVSQKQPWVMQAEPTSPVSLVIGNNVVANNDPTAIRFAAGAALKLAQSQLAILARLPENDLAALVVGLIRLFQADFPYLAVDADLAAAQHQKLRRLIPSGLSNELRPFAMGINAQAFDHRALARGLRVAGLRAGVRAAGGLGVGLRVLAAELNAQDAKTVLAHPIVHELVSWAVGEDHSRLVQL